MGRSEAIDNSFNIASLMNASSDLSFLEKLFSMQENDGIIHDFPNNNSSSMDGFNAEFLKKFWTIVKKDFYDLCNQSICLESINSCFFTLVPKK
jgi:hypothetical protein